LFDSGNSPPRVWRGVNFFYGARFFRRELFSSQLPTLVQPLLLSVMKGPFSLQPQPSFYGKKIFFFPPPLFIFFVWFPFLDFPVVSPFVWVVFVFRNPRTPGAGWGSLFPKRVKETTPVPFLQRTAFLSLNHVDFDPPPSHPSTGARV